MACHVSGNPSLGYSDDNNDNDIDDYEDQFKYDIGNEDDNDNLKLAGVPTYLGKKNRTDSLQHSSDYDSGDNEDDNDKDRYDNDNDQIGWSTRI